MYKEKTQTARNCQPSQYIKPHSQAHFNCQPSQYIKHSQAHFWRSQTSDFRTQDPRVDEYRPRGKERTYENHKCGNPVRPVSVKHGQLISRLCFDAVASLCRPVLHSAISLSVLSFCCSATIHPSVRLFFCFFCLSLLLQAAISLFVTLSVSVCQCLSFRLFLP